MRIWIPLFFVLGFFVLHVGVCLWEKLKVWPYSPPLPIDPATDPHRSASNQNFVDRAMAASSQRGFRMVGLSHDTKGPSYKLSYLFKLSADERTLMYIGYGKMFSIELKAVWLVSHVGDNRLCITTDSASGAPFDVSRSLRYKVFQNISFDPLYDNHQRWMQSKKLVPFDSDDPISQYKEILQARAARLAQKGLLRWADPEKESWRYSLPGAFLFALIGTWAQQFRGLCRDGL
jgi:hypothetical protein